MIITLHEKTGMRDIDTDTLTIEQLRSMGLDDIVDLRELKTDWANKLSALDITTRTKLQPILDVIATRLGLK